MYVYFDENGTLKEIVSDKSFRVGDSKRDKIYIYWEGEHAPVSGWIKYRKPNGKEYPDLIEECFYQLGNQLVGKTLPNKPLRNLKYFSYDHTYEENGEIHIGYQFYEITIPDAILNSSIDNEEVPTENNMVIARIRFVMDDGSVSGEMDKADSIEALGALVFSVETNIGILTDSSINETQYNYLIKLVSMKLGTNTKSIKVAQLPSTGVAGTIYYVEKENNGIVYDAYFWNGTEFVFMGTTSYGLYTKEEGDDFETAIQALWNSEMTDYKALMNSQFENLNSVVSNQMSALQSLINAAASGSPKQVFPTLSALQTQNPDHNYIYVVSADGKWYYWSNPDAAWLAGGIYLSTTNSLLDTDLPIRYIGTVFDGDYYDNDVIMTYPEYKAGDVIDYSIETYVGEGGCIRFYDNAGNTLGTIGRPGNDQGIHKETSSYTIPADFAYAKALSTNFYQTDKKMKIFYIIKRGSEATIKSKLYDYFGIIKAGIYKNGAILFTSLDIKAGDKIAYYFTRQLYEVGCIVFKDSNGTYLNTIGQPSGGQGGAINYSGEYTIPDNFSYAEVAASKQHNDDAIIDISYIYKKDGIVKDLDELYERKKDQIFKVVNLSYFHNIIDNNGNQSFSNENFCGSTFVKLIGGKVKFTFASPWTIYITFFSSIKMVQNASSTWLTAGTHILDVPSDKPYMKIFVSKTGYNTPIDPSEVPSSITVEATGEIIQNSFSKYIIATLGDSITYGTKPDTDSGQIDNPWPETVANLLQFGNIINCGVPSARVLGFPTPNTPPRIWSTQVNTIPEQADIVSVLIGINDMLSAKESTPGYVLGQMSDRDGNSFYGGLHMMWKDLIARYPASSGKKLFMIMYPYIPGYEALWDNWMGACIEVAKYYGIPILDLRDTLGISVAGDANKIYWLVKNGEVDAHPTQNCANLFADAIANFIESHFSINYTNK